MGGTCSAGASAVNTCTQMLVLDTDFGGPTGQQPYSADNTFLPSGPLSPLPMSAATAEAPQQPPGPTMALRVVYAPMVEGSLGARPSPFAEGDEVAVVRVENVPGWEPLTWRHQKCAAGSDGWPRGAPCGRARHALGARIVASDGADGFEEYLCMLQVGVDPEDRDLEVSKFIVDDAKDVAAYAHRFNSHAAKALGEDADPEDIPGVKVSAPVACEVIGSAAPDLASAGETVTLTLYPCSEVRKFVFEGGEDFAELAQAFFHYVSWASGGREVACDLQGREDEEGIVLVDPALLRAGAERSSGAGAERGAGGPGKVALGEVLFAAAAAAAGEVGGVGNAAEERFNSWHPRCSQICRSFDPQRRSARAGRRQCGLKLPTCGVAGGA